MPLTSVASARSIPWVVLRRLPPWLTVPTRSARLIKSSGPGNAWVTEAKRQVSMDFRGAAIDMPAGPSEVLVIADETTNPAFVAADLLSQAEHGPDSQVVLVTPSVALAEQVDVQLQQQLQQLSRAGIASKALASSLTIICDDLPQTPSSPMTMRPSI